MVVFSLGGLLFGSVDCCLDGLTVVWLAWLLFLCCCWVSVGCCAAVVWLGCLLFSWVVCCLVGLAIVWLCWLLFGRIGFCFVQCDVV